MKFIYIIATAIDPGELPKAGYNSNSTTSVVNPMLNIALESLGGLALLMLVISGLRYVISAGDTEKAKRAREGIIYSLVGLTVAIVAKVIVTFIGTNV